MRLLHLFTFLALAALLTGAARAQVGDPRAPRAPAPEDATALAPPDPTVQHVLDLNPRTPEERLRATLVLVNLGQPGYAKAWIDELAAAGLSNEVLAELRSKLGMPMFLRFSRVPELNPAATQLAEAVRAASEQVDYSPERLARVVERLGDPAPEVRHGAEVQLQMAGAAAVNPLLAALLDPGRARQRPVVEQALAALERDAVEPLVATLAARNPALQASAVRVLDRLGAKHTLAYWLRPALGADAALRGAARAALERQLGRVPGGEEAVERLLVESRRYTQAGPRPMLGDLEGLVEAWRWDEATKSVQRERVPVALACAWRAAQLTADAYAIAPEDHDARLAYASALLEAEARQAGLDAPPAADRARPFEGAAGVGVLQAALAQALEDQRDVVAMQAARRLGEVADASILRGKGEAPVPLVRALRHADARTRLAAMEAVMRLEPQRAFAGSSFLTEAMSYFANATGERRVVVADPRTGEGGRLAGMLLELGYEAAATTDGRETFRMAAASPDVELIVLTPVLDRPSTLETLALLRRDHRTARIPVAVIASDQYARLGEEIVIGDHYSELLVRPHTAEALRDQIDILLARHGEQVIPTEARQTHALKTLETLARWSESSGWLFDLHRTYASARRGLGHPELAEPAAALLGRLGTHAAQSALVELVNHAGRGDANRAAAAAAFRESLARRGVMLTTGEVAYQYDRYNQAEHESRESQQALGSVLDGLEARVDLPRVER